MGATKGFAILKFSTSPKILGLFDTRSNPRIIIETKGKTSLTKKKGLNLTLSKFKTVTVGLDDPFSWRRIRWTKTKTAITIGNRKCKEKNRLRVGWETEGPPQIQVTKSIPTKGIADKTPVITVAPQKDICPQGRTYPKNAVAITASMITTPDSHTFIWLKEEAK